MWGLLISNFEKFLRVEFFMMKNLCLFQYSSMKRNKRMVANANVMVAFFIHLHIVIMSDVKNERKITYSRKTSVLVIKLQNV